MKALGPVLAVLVAALVLAASMMFTVDERQNAIVFQLGEVKDVVIQAGPALQVAAGAERASTSTCAS